MSSTVLSVAAGLAATAAEAQERPSTLAMSCAQANRLVATRGAVVLSTGPYTYDRYVGGNFCAINESTEPAWVPTADAAQCFIGYRCLVGPRRSSSR
jgi:hypothetical protein